MKKQIRLGLAAAAVVTMLGAPAVATAAPDGAEINPHSKTNGSIVNPFETNDMINPHGMTNGSVVNPFKGNDVINPHGVTN